MYRPYSGSGVPGSGRPAEAESAVRGLTQDLCTAFNTGNYDQVAALFALDAVYMPPHREWSQGRKAIEQALRQFGDLGYQDLRFETTRVEHSGDMTFEIGRYSLTIMQNQSKTVDRGKFLRAWRRLGTWFIVADSWNSDLPSPRIEMKREGQIRVA